MKKKLSLILGLLISLSAFCQTTPLQSFECHTTATLQGFTQTQIETFISRSDFERYRLLDRRVTLTFDNGFDIVLLSATEAASAGLISNPSSYQTSQAATYRLPVFHLSPNGLIGIRAPMLSDPNSKTYIIKQ